MNKNTTIENSLPNVGEMWELGRNGLSICLDLDYEKREIQWFEVIHKGYFKKSFRSFRKGLKHGWVIKV